MLEGYFVCIKMSAHLVLKINCLRKFWFKIGCNIASEIAELFNKVTSSEWHVIVASVNRVKSCAPCIDHLVFDLN